MVFPSGASHSKCMAPTDEGLMTAHSDRREPGSDCGALLCPAAPPACSRICSRASEQQALDLPRNSHGSTHPQGHRHSHPVRHRTSSSESGMEAKAKVSAGPEDPHSKSTANRGWLGACALGPVSA